MKTSYWHLISADLRPYLQATESVEFSYRIFWDYNVRQRSVDHSSIQHLLQWLASCHQNAAVRVRRAPFNHKCNVASTWVIQHPAEIQAQCAPLHRLGLVTLLVPNDADRVVKPRCQLLET